MKDHDCQPTSRRVMRVGAGKASGDACLGRTSSRGTSSDRECFLILVGKPSAEVPIHTTA
jgi:hypothetical protein